MAIELSPGDFIPPDVSTIFLGADDERIWTTSPDDTWSPSDRQPFDGLHIYEIPVFGATNEGTETVHVQLTRPVVTKRFIEEANAKLVVEGHSPLFIRWDEVPSRVPEFGIRPPTKFGKLFRKIFPISQ